MIENLKIAHLLVAHHKLEREASDLGDEKQKLRRTLEGAEEENQRLRAEINKQNEFFGKEVHEILLKVDALATEVSGLHGKAIDLEQKLGSEENKISKEYQMLKDFDREMHVLHEAFVQEKTDLVDKIVDLEEKLGTEMSKTNALRSENLKAEEKLVKLRTECKVLKAKNSNLLTENTRTRQELKDSKKKITAEIFAVFRNRVQTLREKKFLLLNQRQKMIFDHQQVNALVATMNKAMSNTENSEQIASVCASQREALRKTEVEVAQLKTRKMCLEKEINQLQQDKAYLKAVKSGLQTEFNALSKKFNDVLPKVVAKALIEKIAKQRWLVYDLIDCLSELMKKMDTITIEHNNKDRLIKSYEVWLEDARRVHQQVTAKLSTKEVFVECKLRQAEDLVAFGMTSQQDSFHMLGSAISESHATAKKELSGCLKELGLVEAAKSSLLNEIQVLQGEEDEILIRMLEMEVLSVWRKEQARTLRCMVAEN